MRAHILGGKSLEVANKRESCEKVKKYPSPPSSPFLFLIIIHIVRHVITNDKVCLGEERVALKKDHDKDMGFFSASSCTSSCIREQK